MVVIRVPTGGAITVGASKRVVVIRASKGAITMRVSKRAVVTSQGWSHIFIYTLSSSFHVYLSSSSYVCISIDVAQSMLYLSDL